MELESLEVMWDSRCGFRSQWPISSLYSQQGRDRLSGDSMSASYLLLYLQDPPVTNGVLTSCLVWRLHPLHWPLRRVFSLLWWHLRGKILRSRISVTAMDTVGKGCDSFPAPQSPQHGRDSRSLFNLHKKYIRVLMPTLLGQWTAMWSFFPGYLQLGASRIERKMHFP